MLSSRAESGIQDKQKKMKYERGAIYYQQRQNLAIYNISGHVLRKKHTSIAINKYIPSVFTKVGPSLLQKADQIVKYESNGSETKK